jgi:hypothetical protein
MKKVIVGIILLGSITGCSIVGPGKGQFFYMGEADGIRAYEEEQTGRLSVGKTNSKDMPANPYYATKQMKLKNALEAMNLQAEMLRNGGK